jgi:hypothetical protein
MRKFTLKSLLAVAFLLLGGNVAMADSWSIDFVGMAPSEKKDLAVSISETVVTIGKTTLGTCSYSGGEIDSKFVLQTGSSWLIRNTLKTGEKGLYQYNSGGRAFGLQSCTAGQLITITASGDPNVTTNASLKSSGNGTYVYTVTADGDVMFTPARYLYFYTITVEDPAANAADYTVKYVDENNNEIKTASVYSEAPGTEITLSNNDKQNIVYNGKTYIYVSDDSNGKTVAADGSTVVTVKFRAAATYSYTVNEVCNNVVKNTITGSGDESSTVKVPYHQYILDEGTLYEKTATNKEYNYSFVLGNDGQVENLNYSATDISNVVYFNEAEAIEGATANNGGNANIRCSNSYGAYFDSETTVTTLPAGKYTITMQVWGNAGTTFTIKAGEETVLTGDTKGYITSYTSEEFTLTQETAITIPAAGSNGRVIDWVYIVKTGDAAVPVDVTIGSTGYATLYYGDRALEVPEGVKAFTYTMTGNTLKENTTYEAGDVIPAGEAVVLNGTAGNYTFNLGTATAEKDAQNVLKGSDVEATFNEAGHKYYMLSTNDAGEVGFYWYNDDGSAINCAAHKAYLDVNVTSAKNGYLIDGTEDPTAITAATAEENGTNAVYDLQGRRVMNPVKGLYIVNGKKVIK